MLGFGIALLIVAALTGMIGDARRRKRELQEIRDRPPEKWKPNDGWWD